MQEIFFTLRGPREAPGSARRPPGGKGFTLVELLVALAILSLIMLVLVSAVNQTGSVWLYTKGHIEQFREARDGFEAMTRRLSQATLNTYWDYGRDAQGNLTTYMRQSELRFMSGNAQSLIQSTTPPRPSHGIFFLAPLGYVSDTVNYGGADNLLNTWGYFIEFNNDRNLKPAFVNTPDRYRFRLMESMQPSESMTLYTYTSGTNSGGQPKNSAYVTNPPLPGQSLAVATPSGTGREWFTDGLGAAVSPVHVLAENVVALVILPRLSKADVDSSNAPFADYALSPSYSYDSSNMGVATSGGPNAKYVNSQNQLPPVVQVTMVAVDDASFKRLQTGSAMPDLGLATLFQDASKYDADLATLQQTLARDRLNSRLFTTNVSIKGAKWSRDQ